MTDVVHILNNPPSPAIVTLIAAYVLRMATTSLRWSLPFSVGFGACVYLFLSNPAEVPWQVAWNPTAVLALYGVVLGLCGAQLDALRGRLRK